MLWVPARNPPHKPVEEEPGIEHRLELCRRAVRGDDRFEVSAIEAEREGPSYMVDTLEQLKSNEPDTELFLIVGADVASGLPQWRDPERVVEHAGLAIAERAGTSREDVIGALDGLGAHGRAQFFRMPAIDVSSTIIRGRVRSGEPIRYLVPDAVSTYINEHHLYGGRRN